jgi:ribosomal protein S18 acetylase RimI-like enzyme
MDSLRIVTAAPDDWERVRAVRLAALADAPDAFGSTLAREEPQPESWWRGRLASTDRVTLLAVVDGSDVGMVAGGPHDGDADDAGLYAMWVAPGGRGTGVAPRLIRSVVAWARDAGYRRMLLDVADHNLPAIACYERNGFRPTGRRSTLPPPRDHIGEHELVIDLAADTTDEASAPAASGGHG